jgi:hypothetical protein
MGRAALLPGIQHRDADDCSTAYLLVNAYLAVNIIFNITAVAIVKYGGANM